MNHLWKVRGEKGPYLTRVGREPRDGISWHVRTLEEIIQRRRGSAVPLIEQPPDFEEGNLPLDPYLLGLLIGDGSFVHAPTFGSADPELFEAVEQSWPAGWSWGAETLRQDSPYVERNVNGAKPLLRQMGLMGKRAWEKWVPPEYKFGSAKTRLSVLQGLMDTDGNWASGSVEFCSTSEQLATDVADLARSLGLRTHGLKSRVTSYTYKGEKRRGRTSYRLTIAETPEIRVFRLPRKLLEQPRQRVRGLEGVKVGARKHWARDQRVKWIRAFPPLCD